MGIGRQEAKTLIDNVRAGTGNRTAFRDQLVEALVLLQNKVFMLDQQLASAQKDFAASKQGQFNTFVDALPEPPTDQTP